MNVQLRSVVESDLPLFFTQQRDPDTRYRVAFVVANPDDWDTFQEKWDNILREPTATVRTILVDGVVVGNMGCHGWYGRPEVGYWIDREYWGRGIATQALNLFLAQLPTRPLYAFCAHDNGASLRVLQKCGFVMCAHAKEYSNARATDVEGVVLELRH